MDKLRKLDKKCRVLTMDGGPSPLLQTRLLREIERKIPGFLERTDMFAGTSDGALTTLFLAARLTRGDAPAKILDDAVEFSNGIVNALDATWCGLVRLVLGYAAMDKVKPLRDLISAHDAYGDLRIGDLNRRAMVVSFDAFNWEPRYFRNFPPYNHGRSGEDAAGPPLVSAALASSAFPMYLPLHFGPGARHYIDGGLVANNPSMCALVSAAGMLRSESGRYDDAMSEWINDVYLLSFGATESAEERRATVRPPAEDTKGPLPPKPRVWPQETDANPHLLRESKRRMGLDNWPQHDIDWGWYQWLLRRPLFLMNTMLQAPTKAIVRQCEDLLGKQHHRYAPAMGEIAAGLSVMLLPSKVVIADLDKRADTIVNGRGPENEKFNRTLAWIEDHWMKEAPHPAV